MSQVSKYPLKEEIYNQIFNLLTIVLTKSFHREVANNILNDLLTPTEKIIIAKRLATAVLLKKGYNYSAIQHILRVSKPTIAHINTQLKYGKNGLNYFTDMVQKDSDMSQYLDSVLEGVLRQFTYGKGSGVWKYLHTELKKNIKGRSYKSKIV